MLLAASLAYTAVNHGDANVVYLSTFSRAAELLAGVLLAVVVARRGGLPAPGWRVLGLVAGAVLVAAMALTSLDDPAYAGGGLFVAAVVAVVVLIGATGGGVLERVFSVGPLRYVGRVSYAVYLFHWPILMAFREAGVEAWFVAPVTVVATFALAAAVDGRGRGAHPQPAVDRRLAPGAGGAHGRSIVVVCLTGWPRWPPTSTSPPPRPSSTPWGRLARPSDRSGLG